MPCFHPLPAWRSRSLNPSGKRGVTFTLASALGDGRVGQLGLPCGKCDGCVAMRAGEWALRCEHEALLYDSNWFLTLTYREVPPGGSLRLKDLQLFWKRLRKLYPGVRYFACGEYGEDLARPHYHVLAFNLLLPDMSMRRRSDGKVMYGSAELERLWGLGSVWIDQVTPGSIRYVTSYMLKAAPPSSSALLRPFQVMSRRPGLGRQFISSFLSDVYPDGFVTRPGGSRRRAPRYYDLVCESVDPRMFRRVKRLRAAVAAGSVDRTGPRLLVREAVDKGASSWYSESHRRSYEGS